MYSCMYCLFMLLNTSPPIAGLWDHVFGCGCHSSDELYLEELVIVDGAFMDIMGGGLGK